MALILIEVSNLKGFSFYFKLPSAKSTELSIWDYLKNMKDLGNLVSNIICILGKNQFKSAALNALESGRSALDEISKQACTLGCVSSPKQVAAAIDSVTEADVNAVSIVCIGKTKVKNTYLRFS